MQIRLWGWFVDIYSSERVVGYLVITFGMDGEESECDTSIGGSMNIFLFLLVKYDANFVLEFTLEFA